MTCSRTRRGELGIVEAVAESWRYRPSFTMCQCTSASMVTMNRTGRSRSLSRPSAGLSAASRSRASDAPHAARLGADAPDSRAPIRYPSCTSARFVRKRSKSAPIVSRTVDARSQVPRDHFDRRSSRYLRVRRAPAPPGRAPPSTGSSGRASRRGCAPDGRCPAPTCPPSRRGRTSRPPRRGRARGCDRRRARRAPGAPRASTRRRRPAARSSLDPAVHRAHRATRRPSGSCGSRRGSGPGPHASSPTIRNRSAALSPWSASA